MNKALKVGSYMALGAIGGSLIGKLSGEVIEHIPYVNDAARYVIDFFKVNGDIGNLFSFSGFVYGPNIAYNHLIKRDKEKNLKKILDRNNLG